MIDDAEIQQWAVTTDAELAQRLLAFWETPRGDLRIEDYAHRLGLEPDPARGQVDSIFLLSDEDGRQVLMWEPGPGRDDHADEPEDLGGEGNPWT